MKVKFGAIITEGSGKLGGHVVSKNRGGAFMRTKVTPSNPQTQAQSSQRSILGSLSKNWATLTIDERKSWNDAVGEWAKTDIFGDIRKPSGLNLFVKINANLSTYGYPNVTVPPLKQDVPYTSLDVTACTVNALNVSLVFADTSYAGVKVRIQATSSMSPGISNFKNKLRNIGDLVVSSTSISATDLYTAKFGSLVTGTTIHIGIAPVLDNGQQGQTATYTFVVQ